MSAAHHGPHEESPSAIKSFDAIIVGAGFAGMYMLHRLRGLGLSARVYEQGGDIGGTWYWNRYPGARCDVESMQYSYSFSEYLQQEWEWTERYAPQPEILKYANHVADRFELRRDIQLNTRINSALFEEPSNLWSIKTSDGKTVTATYFILATGCLSNARIPDFKGCDSFQGKTYHTGHWPHEPVDFTGLRVGVIGTGSSAIQSIPIIAEQASHLYVFQRTPNFSIPAHNMSLAPEVTKDWKENYAERRRRAREDMRNGILLPVPQKGAREDSKEQQRQEYEAGWERGGISFMASYNDLLLDHGANDTAANFVREKIAHVVQDPAVAKLLQPHDHPIGSKRICVDTGYYETFNRPNVTLIDIKSHPIDEVIPHGLRTGQREYELDAIVFATGFDAMTGSVAKIDIRGKSGLTLNQKWAEGPRAYLGLMSADFPNMFIITGPGSPSVLSNMIVSIEQHVDWITGCIDALRTRGLDRIEATEEAENDWITHVNEVAHRTVYPQANSWYMGANIPGKPRIFMPYIGGVGAYRQICNDVVAKGYKGFALTTRQQMATVAVAAK
jgi:cyclohexanone monooxygenase